MRKSELKRKTGETNIALNLNLDGTGAYDITTDSGFFKHMLELFAKHGGFDITLNASGDSEVDFHHTVEDTGILLGRAFDSALGDKRGICRYGQIILPMDETLILCAVDVSGRSFLNFDVSFPENYKIGEFDAELVEEFMQAFVREAKMTVHFKQFYGSNNHHVAEGVFKAFARALKTAVAIDEKNKDVLPSTKGVL